MVKDKFFGETCFSYIHVFMSVCIGFPCKLFLLWDLSLKSQGLIDQNQTSHHLDVLFPSVFTSFVLCLAFINHAHLDSLSLLIAF